MVIADSVIGLNCEKNTPTPCDHCLAGKPTRQQFPKRSPNDMKDRTTVLELVHADLMRPIDVPSWGGKRYMFSIVDDASRYVFVRFLKQKGTTLSEFKK